MSSGHIHNSSCVKVWSESSFGGADVMVKNVCSQKIEKVTIGVHIYGDVPPFEKRERELDESNLMPGKTVRAGKVRMSDDNDLDFTYVDVK